MHVHLRVQHWVLWWFVVGIVCGIVAVVNIFTRNLTQSQDHIILLFGVLFWALGGVVCWATGSIEHHGSEHQQHWREHHP